jgi:hypothetical protein
MDTMKLTKGELTKIILQEVRRLDEQGVLADPATVNAARAFFDDLGDPELVAAFTLVMAARKKQ